MIHLIKFNFSPLGGQLEKRSRWIHVQHTTGTEACQSCSWNLKIICPRRIQEFKSLWAYPKNSNNNKGEEKVNNPEKGKAFIWAVLIISVIFVSKTYWLKKHSLLRLHACISNMTRSQIFFLTMVPDKITDISRKIRPLK